MRSLVLFLTCVPLLCVRAKDLEITVDPVYRGEPLKLDSLRYANASGETFSISRLSYLLSGFALQDENGQWIEQPMQIAWIDSASRRNVFRLAKVAEGKYRAVRFYLGPDAEANAVDVAKLAPEDSLNPNVNGLHWSWQGGYIFLALEGQFRVGNDALTGYSYHLARDPNRTCITLAAPIDLTLDAGMLLHFDIATLLTAPRPLSFGKAGTSTHSREGDPIAAALVANLPAAFSVARVVSSQPFAAKLPPVQPIDLPEKFTPCQFVMSRAFPIPDLPRDNPLIDERVALGKMLFHEKALSADGTISCATCHQEDKGHTDGLAVSIGIQQRVGDRNAMPLRNLAWKHEFFWDGRAKSLREQVLIPIQDHREMAETLEHVCTKLSDYAPMFQAAFKSPGVTPEKIALSLEQYLLTLTAFDAKLDRAMQGRETLTKDEQRGFELFMTENEPRTGQFGADCFHCHGGALFTEHQFHNNGLSGATPGRAKVTGSASDQGKFSTPSLRNVALTAPYMHDGRFKTLEEVIAHYSSGVQRTETLDPNLSKHPGHGLNLSAEDQAALVAFLKTLTDLP